VFVTPSTILPMILPFFISFVGLFVDIYLFVVKLDDDEDGEKCEIDEEDHYDASLYVLGLGGSAHSS